MKTKLLSLAVAVLGIPILAHALTLPGNAPGAACTNAPSTVIAVFNAVLTLLGLGPVC